MVKLRIPIYSFILCGLAFVSANPLDPGDNPGNLLKDSLAAAEGNNLVSFILQRFNDQII